MSSSSSQQQTPLSTKPKVDPNGKYYEWLGIENWQEATAETIQKAFRKKASQYHPDRVSDENKKKEYEHLFSKITEANTILKDPELKSKYDLILKQAEYKERQQKEMDAKTKDLRESLELREKLAQQNKLKKEKSDQVLLNKEMAYLIKESGGYDMLHQVQEKRREREKKQKNKNGNSNSCQVIVKWKKTQDVTEDSLKVLFSRLFGPINIMIFKESKRRCVISFESSSSAQKAANYDWKEHTQYKFKVKMAGSEDSETKKRELSTPTRSTSDENNDNVTPEEDNQNYDLNLRLMRLAAKKQKTS
uniref:Putative heat shock 40 kDa protein n=1 Tax=Naegleria fowleri TaxID=5763 RepID=M1H4N9_NAEFO|nr:putative heat shock 40 kDa protein [Naegleria fowleri]